LAVAATGRVVGLADRLARQPAALAAVLSRTLDPDPHRRPTAAEFALELRAALPPERVRLAGGRVSGGRAFVGGRARATGSRPPAAVGRHSTQWAAANRAGSVSGIGRRGADSDDNPARLAAELTQVSLRPRPGPASAAETRPGRRFDRFKLGGRRLNVLIAAGVVLVLAAIAALTLGRSDSGAGSPVAALGPAGSSATRGTAGSPSLITSTGPNLPAGSASPTDPAGSASPIDPAGILTRLDRLRSAAYAQRRPELLHQVYRSATLLAADTAQLLRSVPAGCQLTGLNTDYRQLQASGTAGRLQIRTVASLPAGALACAGTVRGHTPPVGPVRLEITLSDTGSGYLLDGERLLETAH
jgi:hypothetical protein